MRKKVACLLAFCVCTISLSAFDLSGSLHVDTYGGSHAVGFSFFAEENIFSKFAMRVQTDYLTAKEYDIQILGIVKLAPITFGGSFALEVTNNSTIPISPGMGILFDWQITKRLSWALSGIVAFTPENLGTLHDIRAKTTLFYNTENVNAEFSYKVKKGIATTDFINTLDFQTEAFEEGIPIGLIVGAGADILMLDTGFDLKASVKGGLSVYAGKYGTYFAKTKVGVFSMKSGSTIPYEIVLGARFSL